MKLQELLNGFDACPPGMEWLEYMTLEQAVPMYESLLKSDRDLAIKFGLWLVDKMEKSHGIIHDNHIKKTVKPGMDFDIYYAHISEKIINKLKELLNEDIS